MRALTLTLVAFLLISCSDNPTDAGDEPQKIDQIGAWAIYDDNHAEWTGASFKNKVASNTVQNGDTVLVDASYGKNVNLFKESIDKEYAMHYTDSDPLSWIDLDADVKVSLSDTSMYSVENFGPMGVDDPDNISEVLLNISINRTSESGQEPSHVYFTISKGEDEITYDFYTVGIDSALKVLD